MKLIVGLGNPGEKFKNTRHNLGWLAIDALRQQGAFEAWKKSIKFKGELAQSEDKQMILLKPQTFMNESGQAVAAVMKFYKIKPANLVVAHDDLDLPVGTYKLQTNRGAAGHHGVESIINSLGTKNFTRLRLGIKPLAPTKQNKDFVLGKFNKEESSLVNEAVKQACEALYAYLAKQ